MTLLDRNTDHGCDITDHRPLRARAAFLRDVALGVEPILATSIRRRASELELQAWILELRDGI